MSIEAMKQALDALEFIPASGSMLGALAEEKRLKTITALRQAIEQAETQEPVARVAGYYSGFPVIEPMNPRMVMPVNMALYTRPPAAQRQPLTDKEIEQALDKAQVPESPGCWGIDLQIARAVEAAHGITGESK